MPYSRRKIVVPKLREDRTSLEELVAAKTKTSVDQASNHHVEDAEDEKVKVIEQFLGKQRNTSKHSISAPYPSMETPYAFPSKAIKVEDDCLSDIYNVSDRGYIKMTFDTSRGRSKSTAQLSTPVASRPTSTAGDQESIARECFVKYENDQGYIREGKTLHNGSTPPASSPERCASPFQKQNPIPFILQRDSRNISPLSSTRYESVRSSIVLDESLTNTKKWTSKDSDKTSIFDLESQIAEFWKAVNKRQIQYPVTSSLNPERMSRPEPTSILPPIKFRNPSWQTSATPVPILFGLPRILTPDRPITIEGNVRDHTPGGLRTRDDVSHLRNPKSASPCPRFGSPYGPNDNIPSSKEVEQEAAEVSFDSVNNFVTKRLSGAPSWLKKRRISPLIQDDIFPRANDDGEDIYTSYESDYHLQLTPEPLHLSQKIGQDPSNNKKCIETHGDLVNLGKLVMQIEKEMPHLTSRPMQLFPRVPRKFEAARGDNERNRPEYLDFSEDEDASDRIECHNRSGPIAGSNRSGRPEASGVDHSTKRDITESISWHPGLLFDNDTPGDEEILEIGRDDFEKSERNKPKRQKLVNYEIGKDVDARGRERKETVHAENDVFCEEMKECQMAVVASNESWEETQRRLSAHCECEYNMHSYFDHGMSNTGRLAREGFICYIDFRKYCKESSQPVKDTFTRFKKDLKHLLTCQDHQVRRPDLFKIALFVELTPGFVLKSCHPNEEVRRREDESIGNAPKSPARSPAPVTDAEKLEALERESRYKEVLIAELLKKVKDLSSAEKRTRRIMGPNRKPARRARQGT